MIVVIWCIVHNVRKGDTLDWMDLKRNVVTIRFVTEHCKNCRHELLYYKLDLRIREILQLAHCLLIVLGKCSEEGLECVMILVNRVQHRDLFVLRLRGYYIESI